jgi:hypothetical protein
MRSFRYGCFAEPTLLAFHDLPSSLLSLPSLQHAQCSLSGSVISHARVWDVKHVVELRRGRRQQVPYLRRVANVVIGRHPACLELPVDGRRFQSITIKVCMNQYDNFAGMVQGTVNISQGSRRRGIETRGQRSAANLYSIET